MNALARKCIQVDRQGSGEGFALARAHFRNFPVVQCHATEQLHIEMAHLHDALGAFSHHSKRLGQQIVQRLPLGDALLELLRLGAQRIIGQLLVVGLHRIDACNRLAILPEQPVIAAAEKFGEEVGGHANRTAPHAPMNMSGDRNP